MNRRISTASQSGVLLLFPDHGLPARSSIVDQDFALQNLRTSDNGGYIDFLCDHLGQQGIETIACDLGADARGHRYALLLPHERDAARAWQLLNEAPGEADSALYFPAETDHEAGPGRHSAIIRDIGLGLLALLLAGLGLQALFS